MAKNLNLKKQVTPYSTLKSAFGWGFYLLLTCLIFTALGLGLSVSENLLLWFPGQLILAVALLQWFILLHESGHYTLFPEKIWNHVTGHLASLFSAIPFYSWSQVHHLHHVWTGWQDLDPTTETLASTNLSAWKRSFTNVCWKFHIPVFAIIYRIQNFWNLRRLEQFIISSERLKKMRWNFMALLLIYGLLGYQLGTGKNFAACRIGPAAHFIPTGNHFTQSAHAHPYETRPWVKRSYLFLIASKCSLLDHCCFPNGYPNGFCFRLINMNCITSMFTFQATD